MATKSKERECPYCQKKIRNSKYLKGDLIHHFWGSHGMDAPQAHKAAEYFIDTGKILDETNLSSV